MMQLSHSTRIAVQFIIEDDSGRVVEFIAALTVLVQLLSSFAQFVSRVGLFAYDVVEAVTFAAKVWAIWFNAFGYGLGVIRV